MTRLKRRRSDRSGRAPLPSPGRPAVAGRDELRRFWAAIALGCPVKMLPPAPTYLKRSERDGSGRPAECHQQCLGRRRGRCPADIFRLPNARRSRSYEHKAALYGRWRVRSDVRRQRSRGSCGATPPPAAAGWSIARRPRNGTPSDPPDDQSRQSLC